MRGASPDGSHPGLHSKPVDAAIRRVLASHCHGGHHGLTILVENTQHKQTRNPTFTYHLTLTPVRLTSLLTHTQPHHHSHLMDVPPTPLALITISSLPPTLPLDPNSPDVLQIITANADSHLQNYERKNLGRTNKTDPSTSTITHGDTVIGDGLTLGKIIFGYTPKVVLPPQQTVSNATMEQVQRWREDVSNDGLGAII